LEATAGVPFEVIKPDYSKDYRIQLQVVQEDDRRSGRSSRLVTVSGEMILGTFRCIQHGYVCIGVRMTLIFRIFVVEQSSVGL